MKPIKVNLKDKDTINNTKDILWIIIAILLLFISVGQVKIEEEHKEIRARYEQIKEYNTVLIKDNNELSEYVRTFIKEANEQPRIVNNLDTRRNKNMKKIRIIKNNEIIFESSNYITYDNKKYIEFDFANLRYADLSNADLSKADLRNADLSYADLSNADLSYADLSKADLSYADLSNANLSKANLRYANLNNADLAEEEQIRKGKIIKDKIVVYKKCQEKIVELELQGGSIVFSINNYKCRTNKAKVISIDGKKTSGLKIESDYDENFVYEVGKIVEVKDFNLMYNVECTEGIHFFFKKEDAKNYNN